MKKVTFLVALFLVGMATQTFAQRRQNVTATPGSNHRYYKSQEIRFVEDGVLYTVATDGSFDFTMLRNQVRRNHYDRNYSGHYNANSRTTRYNGARRNYRNLVKTDRYGYIIGIGETCITYNRRGKVKTVGSVPLHYQRGQLLQVGNLQIIYNRFGEIRDTHGYVNRFNKRLWHDGWYTNNIRNRATVQVYDNGRKRKKDKRYNNDDRSYGLD